MSLRARILLHDCESPYPCDPKNLRSPPLPSPDTSDSLKFPLPPPSPEVPLKVSGVRHFPHVVVISACILASLSLLFVVLTVVFRHRSISSRASLVSPPVAADASPSSADTDPHGGYGSEEPMHHAWYIRTVGLEESAIQSIAVTRYHVDKGSADCMVCLGELADGDLVRLLPKCAHPFHVECIDKWLRTHINCPLCRSLVLDPAVNLSTPTAAEIPPSSSEEPQNPANLTGGNLQQEEQPETELPMAEVFVDIPLEDAGGDFSEGCSQEQQSKSQLENLPKMVASLRLNNSEIRRSFSGSSSRSSRKFFFLRHSRNQSAVLLL